MNLRTTVCLFLAGATIAAMAAAMPVAQDHEKYSYALVGKNHDTFMNWDGGDMDAWRNSPPDRLYVKKENKVYVISDKATIAQFRKIIQPMIDIGRKQSAIGDQQSKIGDQQSKIGEQQSALGARMGEIGERMGHIAEASANGSKANEKEQQKLQDEMDALQKKMDALSKQMEEPSRKQDALGKKQDALGRQQDAAQKAAAPKIENLIDDAFAKGLAKPA